MGLSHCSILNAHPDVEMVGVCDASTFLLDAFRKHSRHACYEDFEKMLNESHPDCVMIATPTKYHAGMAELSLSRGIHTFIEKPFTLSLPDDIKLVELAKTHHLVNQVGFHNRFIGVFREVKRLLDMGILGELYHFVGEAYGPVVLREGSKTWRSEDAEGGGCLLDYASHVINLLNYFFGEPHQVKGTVLPRIYSSGVEDAVYSTLNFPSGISGILSVNWSDETYRKMSTQITIQGTQGKIIADAQELRIFLRSDNKKEGFAKGWNIRYLTDLTPPVSFYLRGEEYSSQIDYFIQCIKGKKTDNINSFENALRTDRVIALLREDALRK